MGRVTGICSCGKEIESTHRSSGQCKACTDSHRAKRREEKDKLIHEALSRGCIVCEESDIDVLVLHHVDPTTKFKNAYQQKIKRNNGRTGISELRDHGYSLQRMVDEIAKCVTVCANCHIKIHKGKVDLGPICVKKGWGY